MFSQRKKIYEQKWLYALIGISIFVFGLWINWQPGSLPFEKETNDSQIASKSKPTEEDTSISNTPYGSDRNTPIENAATTEEDPSADTVTEEQWPCYFVREEEGLVKIYYYDEMGEAVLIRTTAISFSLLRDTDQMLFQKGVVKKTKDDLNELLQDFES